MKAIGIVLAAGQGLRFGGARPKQFLDLTGKMVLEHPLHAFLAHEGIAEVLVIHPEGCEAELAAIRDRLPEANPLNKPVHFAPGGTSRPASTRAALALLGAQPETTLLLFHDGVRPFLSESILSRCLAALETAPAVATLVPSTDTVVILSADGSRIASIPPRASLARNQTPQGFRLGAIRAAYAALTDADLSRFTDDCGVLLAQDPSTTIAAVAGHESNLKITTPQDLELAEQLLRRGLPQ